jgi:hypothetical protein
VLQLLQIDIFVHVLRHCSIALLVNIPSVHHHQIKLTQEASGIEMIHVHVFGDRLCGLVVRVPGYRFPVLSDFPRSSGSGTGSTQPRDYNWGAAWKKSSGSGLEIREYGRRDSSHWPRGSLYPQKLALTSPTNGGRSVGIVRSRTQTTEFSLV